MFGVKGAAYSFRQAKAGEPMANDGSPVSDVDIVLMMMEHDEEGLRLFLKRYGGRLKGFLVK